MNEHTGIIVCPNCKMLWQSDQWACSYCGSTEPPPAIKAPGPAWVWWLAAGVVLLAIAIDASYGGHGLRFVRNWTNRNG